MNVPIHICFCSDENLVKYIPVVLNSIQSKNALNQLIIHYIHTFSNSTLLEPLQKYIDTRPNMTLHTYHKVWERTYEGLPHVSSATMVRLFIPELIQASKVIYLDIDLIVQMDLQQLFSIDCAPIGIAMKESLQEANGVTILQFEHGKSGNCGVMVMDLDILRRENFLQKCLEIHERKGGHDQFVINMYTSDRYTHLPSRFNIFQNQDDFLVEMCPDFILHYSGHEKPYATNTGKYQYLWNSFNCNIKNYEFINFIDKIVYINLPHRTDRKFQIEKELDVFPKNKIVRFPGIYNKQHGGIGCTQSHIEVLLMAIKNNWKNYIVIEDDAVWNNIKGTFILNELLQKQYDVILLGHINAKYNSDTYKVTYATTTTSYLVSNHYYATLLQNFIEGLSLFKHTNIYEKYAIDQYWLSLMKKDNWYCIAPSLFIQRPNFSDILKKPTNYTPHFT
jgi:glycosyl transferase family 25